MYEDLSLDWQLLLLSVDSYFGEPQAAGRFEATFAPDAEKRWDDQIIYPLAYLLQNRAPGNPWQGSKGLLAYIEKLAECIFAKANNPDESGTLRRSVAPTIQGYRLLRDHLANPRSWETAIHKWFRNRYLLDLHERDRLSTLSSANIGYGTNHLAVELSALTAYVAAFRDDPNWDRTAPDGSDLEDYASQYLERFMAHMDWDGGYWAESDGPAYMYNFLTANSLLCAAHDLREVERYRQHFERAAWFHTNFMLPNFVSVGLIDGRNPQDKKPSDRSFSRQAFLGFTAEGRAVMNRLKEHSLKTHDPKEQCRGHDVHYRLLNIILADYLTDEQAPCPWELPRRTEAIRDDFLVHQNNNWIASANNFVFRPRPEGHFNFDYQNLFMLFHKEAGVIFEGSHSKCRPEAATFHKKFDSADGYKLDVPEIKYIPGKGTLTWTEDGIHLHRPYRGFEGILNYRILAEDNVVLDINVNASRSEYPVTCSLLVHLFLGMTFESASKMTVLLAEDEPFTYSSKTLGGEIRFQVPDFPRTVSLSLPAEAELLWPFKGWNCYNMDDDTQHSPGAWDCLLNIPVGIDGVAVEVMIGDRPK